MIIGFVLNGTVPGVVWNPASNSEEGGCSELRSYDEDRLGLGGNLALLMLLGRLLTQKFDENCHQILWLVRPTLLL